MESSGFLYVFGVCQFIINLCIVLFSPSVKVQGFLFTPQIENGTLTHDPGDVLPYTISMSVPLLLTSFLAVLFVENTYSLYVDGQLSTDNLYSAEVLSTTGLWDTIFWIYVLFAHWFATSAMATPLDLFALLLALVLQTHFLYKICVASANDHEDAVRPYIKGNQNMLGLATGYVIAAYNIPRNENNRYTILLFLLLFDYFLCIGHTWDAQARVGTITNCRIFYVCCMSICLGVLYAVWKDKLLFSPATHDY